MKKRKLESVLLKNIRIKDDFWDRYIKLVKGVIIPYQWRTLNDEVPDAEPSHCIKNFRIAAGEETGEFEGAVFQRYGCSEMAGSCSLYPGINGRDEELEKLADEPLI